MTRGMRVLLGSSAAAIVLAVALWVLAAGLTRYLPEDALFGSWAASEAGQTDANLLIRPDGTFSVENLPRVALLGRDPSRQGVDGVVLDWSDVVSFDGRWYFDNGTVVLSTDRGVSPVRTLSADLKGWLWDPQLSTIYDVDRGRTLKFNRD